MNSLIAYLKTGTPSYRDEIERFGDQKENMEDLFDQDDELLDDAVRVVLETGQASNFYGAAGSAWGILMACASRDMMGSKGIVGPHV